MSDENCWHDICIGKFTVPHLINIFHRIFVLFASDNFLPYNFHFFFRLSGSRILWISVIVNWMIKNRNLIKLRKIEEIKNETIFLFILLKIIENWNYFSLSFDNFQHRYRSTILFYECLERLEKGKSCSTFFHLIVFEIHILFTNWTQSQQ